MTKIYNLIKNTIISINIFIFFKNNFKKIKTSRPLVIQNPNSATVYSKHKYTFSNVNWFKKVILKYIYSMHKIINFTNYN